MATIKRLATNNRKHRKGRTNSSFRLESLEQRLVFDGVGVESFSYVDDPTSLVRYEVETHQAESVNFGSALSVANDMDSAGRVDAFTGDVSTITGPTPSGPGHVFDALIPDDSPERGASGILSSSNIVIGADDRIEVDNERYPFTSIGRVWTLWSNGSETSASGAVFGQRHVITAGNAVYDASRGGWASQVYFSPGQDGNALFDPIYATSFRRSDEQIYGEARAESMTTFNGWINDTNAEFNMGFLELDRNIGTYTGWMGWGYNNNDSFFQGSIANHAGYPGDRSPGEYDQWFDSGVISSVSTNVISSNSIDNAAGQNGGPLWLYFSDTGERTVYGVSGSFRGSVPDNGFTRITRPRFETMQNMINGDGLANDRPDLVDWDRWFNTSFAGVSDTQLRVGDLLTATAFARNNGTATSNTFSTRFRLSSDTTYDASSDIWLGDVEATGIAPFDYRGLSLTAGIPELTPGTYYIVYSIDAFGEVSEYNDINNTGFIATPITILAAAAEDAFEQNDSFSTAAYIGTDSRTLSNLTIDQAFDDDYFAWTAPIDGTVTVNTIFSHSLGDIDLQLLDGDGQVIALSDSVTDNEQVTAVVVEGQTYVIRVYGYAGAVHPTYDLTVDGPEFGQIQGRSWHDGNGDGVVDPGEEGLEGWTIYLDINDNRQLDAGEPTTITDENGDYTFTDVPAGEYAVAQVLPPGWGQTSPTPDSPSPTGEFQIDVIFGGGLTASQEAIFADAADRWAEIITGDIPDVITDIGLVDDVAIDASGVFIDGAGGILGQAGPTWLRSGSYLPARGVMQFDSADLSAMESNGTLLHVILHEMGHVLGLGTIWDDLGLVVGLGGTSPQFVGPQATAEYNSIFGLSSPSVPVENNGGPGTAGSHWEESVFDNELMTGYINGTVIPLSRVTAAQFADLGYQVNLDAADAFSPPSSRSRLMNGGYAGEVVALDLPVQFADVPSTLSDALPSGNQLSSLGDGRLSSAATPGEGVWIVNLESGQIVQGLDFGNVMAGDANGDGQVDVSDMNIVATNWQRHVDSWSEGDFTGDGFVNGADLNVVAANWHQTMDSIAPDRHGSQLSSTMTNPIIASETANRGQQATSFENRLANDRVATYSRSHVGQADHRSKSALYLRSVDRVFQQASTDLLGSKLDSERFDDLFDSLAESPQHAS